MSSDDNGSSDSRGRKPRNGKRLSLWPLTLDEAVGAVVQVPPPPKKAKAPKGTRPSENGERVERKPR